MAISKDTLEQRLDGLDVEKDVQSALFDEPDAAPVEQEAAVSEDVMVPPAPAPILDPEPAQPVQVAGGFKSAAEFVAKKIAEGGEKLKKAEEAAEEAVIPPAPRENIFEAGGTFVIREAEVEELGDLADFMDTGYNKGINFIELADDVTELDLAELMDNIKKANPALFEAQRRGTISYEELLKQANKQGMNNVVRRFLRREPGEPANAEQLMAGILAVKGLAAQTRKAFLEAFAMPPSVERQAALSRAQKLLTLSAGVTSSVSGAGSEAGRATRAMGLAQQIGVGDVKVLSQQLEGLLASPNAQDIEFLGERFLSLDTDLQRATFAKQSLYARGRDAIIEIWINSILSGFSTHAINILGNTSFMTLRTAETALAGGIGKARTAMGLGGKDRVYATEALVELRAMRNNLFNAFIAAGKTARLEESRDLASKIDTVNRRAIGTTGDPMVALRQLRQGEVVAGTVNLVGMYYRLGGRALLAEDEFFKAIAYRARLERTAFVEGRNTYDLAIEAGKTPDEAAAMARAEQQNIIDNPQDYPEISANAEAAAREMTFQGDLDGIFRQMQDLTQYPLIKLLVPFFKTPTNIMKETFKRSPVMLANPNFYRKLSAGGREADEAMAQVTLGSAMGAALVSIAVGGDKHDDPDFFITGAGPSDFKAKQAMMRQNINPYSFNIKQEDGTYISIPFRGMEPMSGVLGMAADFADYIQYEDDPDVIMGLALAFTVGAGKYAMEHPMLDGIQAITKVSMGASEDPMKMANNLLTLFAEKGSEAFLAPIPTVSSFTAGLERYFDPTKRTTKLPAGKAFMGYSDTDITDLPPYLRGFYGALARAKARNPIFSKGLPPEYNLYGEERKEGRGYLWEMYSPIRVKQSKYNVVDQEIVRLGDGPRMPRKDIGGVILNRDQYNRLVLMGAQMDNDGNMPGSPGYDPTQAMLPQLGKLIRNPSYKSLPDDMKIDEIKNLVSVRQRAAKLKLQQEDRALFMKVNPEAGPGDMPSLKGMLP